MNTPAYQHVIQLITRTSSGIRVCINALITPRSTGDDDHRHEYILNIILVATLGLVFLLDISVGFSVLTETDTYNGISPWIMLCITLIFSGLLLLSRKGNFKQATFGFIGAYSALVLYGVIHWSFVLPMLLLGCMVIIVISGILISTRFSVWITAGLSVALVIVTHLQYTNIIPVALYWRTDPVTAQDAFEAGIIFFVVTTLSWLSNREMEKSLIRARKSEQELIQERNSLEIRVEERTRELKEIQLEQVSHVQHFADLGKISGGIFHDLMNPLNAVVASIEHLRLHPESIDHVMDPLQKAVTASRRMGEYLTTIRSHIKPRNTEESFLLLHEVEQAMDMVAYHARRANVRLVITSHGDTTLFGNPILAHQVALNLITNAIDAYATIEKSDKEVRISVTETDSKVLLTVTDQGCGIPKELHEKIFEAFYTTKEDGRGLGIGLATVKRIVETSFGGTIELTSTLNVGTTFRVHFIRTNS